jgi:hypothetical protein
VVYKYLSWVIDGKQYLLSGLTNQYWIQSHWHKNVPICGKPFGMGTAGIVPFNLLPFSQMTSRLVLSPKDGEIVPEKVLLDRYSFVSKGW